MKEGAYPCIALVTLGDYLDELQAFPITSHSGVQ